jgi:hypothetical protein
MRLAETARMALPSRTSNVGDADTNFKRLYMEDSGFMPDACADAGRIRHTRCPASRDADEAGHMPLRGGASTSHAVPIRATATPIANRE